MSDRWSDTAGAYVLGALPEGEAAAFAAHLESCADCRAEVAELRVAAAALPLAAPALRPPEALKARIMAEVERDTAPPARARPRRRVPLPALALALALAALLAGVVLGGVLFGGGDRNRYPFQSTLPQVSAELDVTDDGAILVAENLPMPAPGKVYMVWLQRPGQAPEPTSALFTPSRDGTATASVTGDLKGVQTVLVNTEPAGGSPAPTSQPLLVADLS